MVSNAMMAETPIVDSNWWKLPHRGADVFLRVTPLPPSPDLGGFVRCTVEVGARRGDDWRFDATEITTSDQRRTSQEIRKRINGVTDALDNGQRIDPNGVYAPLIAELSAL